jgi:4-amino-4-deoxychorismate lyase
MSRFIETIQLLKGELRNLEFHQERFERTRREVLGLRKHPLLAEQIKLPQGLEKGLFKCRVSYGKVIELIEYEQHVFRKVNSLKLVHSDSIDYGYKFADRSNLQILFQQREDCDDILVVKNSCVSDSFYANVIFWDGNDWFTPDTPLLPGTMRAYLLSVRLIREVRITPNDLPGFQKLKLINAMNDLEQAPEIPIEYIHL